jgi:uncharacterized protein (TIGR03435 family)
VKKLMPWIIAFALLSGGTLLAQDITGNWQGTLHAGADLRVVIKISKVDGGGLNAVLYSIDQGGQPVPATVARQGPTVKISVPAIGGAYEGKLDSDGNLIVGTWTQADHPLPLNLKLATADTAWTIPEPPPPPKPMAADANPVFEVATIKPSNPETQGKYFTVRGRRFMTGNTTLSDLLTFAYGLHPRQITGGPAWLDSDKYDLNAQPEGEGQPNDKQWRVMVQKVVADRFKLSFHHDKKELLVYAIVVAKGGAKLTKSTGDPNGLPGLFFQGLGVLPARNATIADFAGVMQAVVLDRPVLDQTGLSGRYDFLLKWTPDQWQFSSLGGKLPPPSDEAAAPDLFTAVQQQLGLKLESVKAPVEVLVIDHVEKPTAN